MSFDVFPYFVSLTAPPIKVLHQDLSPKDPQLKDSEKVSFVCNVSLSRAAPNGIINLYLNGAVMTNGERVKVVKRLNGTVFSIRMEIHPTYWSDSGKFTIVLI